MYTHTRPLYTVQVYKRVYYPAQIRNLIAHIVGMPIINTRRIHPNIADTMPYTDTHLKHGNAATALSSQRCPLSAPPSAVGSAVGLVHGPRPGSAPGRLYQVGSTRSALPGRVGSTMEIGSKKEGTWKAKIQRSVEVSVWSVEEKERAALVAAARAPDAWRVPKRVPKQVKNPYICVKWGYRRHICRKWATARELPGRGEESKENVRETRAFQRNVAI